MNPAEIVLSDHPVQHSYLDTSTSKTDYLSTFLGAVLSWENHLQFVAYFSLLGKISDRLQQRKLRLKQIILDLNKEIDKLLQEAKSRNITN